MQSRTRGSVVAGSLIALVGLAACQDTPTDPHSLVEPEAAFAKGGKKGGGGPPDTGEDIVSLGGLLFADEDLSLRGNQSCQTCHEPSQGFAAPLPGVSTRGSVVEGSEEGQFGDRKPPSAAFATLAPNFTSSGNNAVGGNFWDGRATGEVLGNAAMDQALGPFLNPKEQALPDEACVIWKLSEKSAYVDAFSGLWGVDLGGIGFPHNVGTVCSTFQGGLVELSGPDRATVHEQYLNVARAIAAFEATFNTFDSPFDLGQLNQVERQGAKLFSGKGKCQQCHDDKGSTPLFTDFEYHNLGVPLNRANPVYNEPGEFDPGLGAVTGNPAHFGKFKTPTVRNVALGTDRTFMHNGALISLRQVVQFYNTRDVLPVCSDPGVLDDPTRWGPDGDGCWPPPEFSDNLDTKNMGNLGLTDAEVEAIVRFMEALNSQLP